MGHLCTALKAGMGGLVDAIALQSVERNREGRQLSQRSDFEETRGMSSKVC